MLEESLDNLIICKKCNTIHKKLPLKGKKKAAYCTLCGNKLYTSRPHLLDMSLALCITALIFFIVASIFPIVTIDMQGAVMHVTLPSVFITLLDEHFFFVGLLCAFVIFLFPLMLLLFYMLLLVLFKLKIGENITKKLLVLISYMLPWNMLEIFLISILIALVKLIGYAEIFFGISFWALVLFVLVDLYLYKNISLPALWELHERIYNKAKTDGK